MVRLLRRMCAPGPSRDRWRDELVVLLRAHSVAERDELLGGITEVTAGVEMDLPVGDAVALEQLAVEIEQADLAEAEATQLCHRVEDALGQHAKALRTHVLDDLEQRLARKEIRRLGGRYLTRRDAEVARLGSSAAPPRTLDRSRAELYEMARRLGIQGRSSMTRSQLINALKGHAHS